MTNLKKIAESILGSKNVVSVEGHRETNSDGENIFSIKVIYSANVGTLTAKKMSEMTRKLWEIEIENETCAFPIIDYISDKDIVELHAAE